MVIHGSRLGVRASLNPRILILNLVSALEKVWKDMVPPSHHWSCCVLLVVSILHLPGSLTQMLTVTQTTTALLLFLLVFVMLYCGTMSCVKFKGFSSNISAKLTQIVKAGFEARFGLPDWTVERMECSFSCTSSQISAWWYHLVQCTWVLH